MCSNSSMDVDSLFFLGDSETLENGYDTCQYGDIDWLPTTAARLESHLGLEPPLGRTLLGPPDTTLTTKDHQVQVSGDSNMIDADLSFENQATLTDRNLSGTSRIQDLDLPVAYHLSGLTDKEQISTAGQHPAYAEPGFQTGEPLVVANDHLDTISAPSVKHTTSEDWAKHRILITTLYEKMTLSEVMRYMEQKEGFSATTKMYKSRFTVWGLDSKNNREREMRAAVQKRSQRTQQNRRSIFRIRGKPVDDQEIVRYFARKGLSIEDVVAQRRASRTPETVICLTPITSPIAIPEVYETSQLLFKSISDYVDGSFHSGVWIKSEPAEYCYSARRIDDSASRSPLYLCYEIQALLDLGHLRAAKLVQDSAIRDIHQMLLEEDPLTLALMFELFVKIFNWGTHKIALAVFRAVADIGPATLGQQHPLTRVASFLLRVESSDIAVVGDKCLRAFGDQIENVLGPMHRTSLHIRFLDRGTTDSHTRYLLQRCQSDLGISDTRKIELHLDLVGKLYRGGEDGLAVEECYKLLSHAHGIRDPNCAAEYRARILHILALCENALSKWHLATVHLREAIDIRIFVHGSFDRVARRWLVCLLDWLTHCGGEEEVAEVQRWWELMRQAEVASQEGAIPSPG